MSWIRRPANTPHLTGRIRSRVLVSENLESRWLLFAGDVPAEVFVAAEGESTAAPIVDARLTDANPNSSRFGDEISPRDYLQQVSGWYFGFAT